MLKKMYAVRSIAVLVCSIGLAGCFGKDEKKPVEKKPAVVALKAPPSAMVYGGTGPVSTVLTAVESLGKTVMPGMPPLSTMVGPLVQAEFRLTSNAAIDMNKSLRFALFDPKVFGADPSALLLGVTSSDAFAQALPPVEKKQNDQGNAWSFKRFAGAKNGVYVNFIGQHAVLTGHPKLFESNKGFFEALLKEKLPADGVVYVEMEHVMKGFAQELDAMTKNKAMAQDLLNKQGQSAQLADTIMPWLGSARAGAEDIKQLQGRLHFGADGFKIDGRFIMKKKAKLAKLMADMKTPEHAFLKRLPADAPMVMTLDASPEHYAQFVQDFMGDVLRTVAPANRKAEVDQAVATLASYMQGIDGKVTMAVHGDPAGNGLTSSMLMGIKDRTKVEKAMKGLSQISNNIKTWQAGGGLPGMPTPTTVFQDKAYSVDGFDVSISKAGGSDPILAAGPLAELGTSHFAISDKLAISTQGGSARQIITSHVKSQYKGLDGSPMVKDAFARGAKNAFALFSIAPIAPAKRVSLGGMNPLAMSLSAVPDDGSLTISLGKSEEGALQLVVDLPSKLLQQGMQAFEKVKGGL